MLATGMSALMFVGGVVIDLGSYYSQVSRLQNAADAAAAAGAAVYVDKGTTRIVPITNNIDEEDGFTYNMDGQPFTFKSSDHDKETADSMAVIAFLIPIHIIPFVLTLIHRFFAISMIQLR